MNLDKFMCDVPVYIINLSDSIDRQNSIREEFKDYNNVRLIEAVDGRNEENFNKKYNVNCINTTNLSLPVIAVICSHIKAIKIAYENNVDRVCVFEDDVHTDLIKNCNFTLNDVCSLNDDWECIQLHYTNTGNINILDYGHDDYVRNGLRLMKRTGDFYMTNYIINRKGMKNLLNQIYVNDEMTTFTIKIPVVNVEQTIMGNINSYVINRQVFYDCFDNSTFSNYHNFPNEEKDRYQYVQFLTREKLRKWYC